MSAAQLLNLVSLKGAETSGSSSVDKVLKALREHLGMDVAFVTEFRAHDRVFTHVDAQGESPIKAGDTLPLSAGYCQKVVSGELPQLIADTGLNPLAQTIPETYAVPIGSHMSVPIHLSDGRLYGTFCCFGYNPDKSLGERDMQIMRVFAELLADHLDSDLKRVRDRVNKHQRISEALAEAQPNIVYQPIFDARELRVCGWECLSRFTMEPFRSPDQWFREASEAGLGLDLESRAIEVALEGLSAMPEPQYMALNCSPELILSGRLHLLLHEAPSSRLVLEITEHVVVSDYLELLAALKPLREAGVRVAIDDAGAGYSSMRHILQLGPDIIKLDMSLTQGIDQDCKRLAMASALIAFARETGSTVVAEGVETTAELETLRALGVRMVQGFLLGRPVSLAQVPMSLASRRL